MNGWECPRCGQCYAPHISQCYTCGPRTFTSSGTVPACLHQWVYDTAGTRCYLCGKSWPQNIPPTEVSS